MNIYNVNTVAGISIKSNAPSYQRPGITLDINPSTKKIIVYGDTGSGDTVVGSIALVWVIKFFSDIKKQRVGITLNQTSGRIVYNNSYVENGVIHIDAALVIDITNDSIAIGLIDVTPTAIFSISGCMMNGYWKTLGAIGGYIDTNKQIALSGQTNANQAFVLIQGTRIQ